MNADVAVLIIHVRNDKNAETIGALIRFSDCQVVAEVQLTCVGSALVRVCYDGSITQRTSREIAYRLPPGSFLSPSCSRCCGARSATISRNAPICPGSQVVAQIS